MDFFFFFKKNNFGNVKDTSVTQHHHWQGHLMAIAYFLVQSESHLSSVKPDWSSSHWSSLINLCNRVCRTTSSFNTTLSTQQVPEERFNHLCNCYSSHVSTLILFEQAHTTVTKENWAQGSHQRLKDSLLCVFQKVVPVPLVLCLDPIWLSKCPVWLPLPSLHSFLPFYFYPPS